MSKAVYQEYLDWVAKTAVDELIKRKAGNIKREEGKPPVWLGPYEYNMWFIMDANSGCDFVTMEKRAKQLRRRNTYKIQEALKHVDGNPDKPLLDPTFIARAEATKKLREQSRTYAGGTSAGDDNVLALRKEHGDLLNLDKTQVERPKPSTPKRPGWFKRFWNWFTGDDIAPTSAREYYGDNIGGRAKDDSR